MAGRKRAGGLAVAIALALAAAGCSLAIPGLSSDGDELATGALGASTKKIAPLSSELTPEDWRRARAALALALDPQGNGAAASWDNPETGMKGTISPVGSPFVKHHEVCRAFVASTHGLKGQEWVQGSACRESGEEWAIRDAKPWKKPA